MNNPLAHIRWIVAGNKQVVKNVTWLSVLQVANYLIPLLVIPYIVRVLGVELFGKVSYAQNIISYFTLIVNFGFEYSATRQIAICKDDHDKVRAVFWSVIRQKTVLLLVAFVGLLLLYVSFPKVHDDFRLYGLVFLLNIGVVLFPTWFFQGIEEMGKMAVFNVLIKSLGLLLTVAFVHSAADYLLYPLFTSLSYVACGAGAVVYVVIRYGMRYSSMDKNVARETFKSGLPVFLNNVFVSAYTAANLTVLGFFASDYVLGYYSGANKIIMAIMMVTSTSINMALYPNISRKFALSREIGIAYFKVALKYIFWVAACVSAVTFLFAPLLVRVMLGDDFLDSVPLLRLFAILPLLVTLASTFTVQGLYGMGLQRYAPWVGLSIGIICVTLNLVSIPRWGMYGAAGSWIIAQALEVLIAGTIVFVHMKKGGMHEG